MPQPCLTCIHARRGAIDHALVSSAALGAISQRFGIPVGALQRHRQNHLAQEGQIRRQGTAGSRCQMAAHDPSEFVEVAVVPSVSSGVEVDVELRTDDTGNSLRLRGCLDPEVLRVLAEAVVGRSGSAS